MRRVRKSMRQCVQPKEGGHEAIEARGRPKRARHAEWSSIKKSVKPIFLSYRASSEVFAKEETVEEAPMRTKSRKSREAGGAMSTGGPQRGELFGEDTLERTPTKKKKRQKIRLWRPANEAETG